MIAININHKNGFSLVELMVGMAIGLFLVAGVFTVYLNGRTSQVVVDDQVAMLDNARFALDTMAYDLRHAGLWGRVNEYDPGLGNVTNNLLPAIPGECAPGWVANFSAPAAAFNEMNPYGGTCATNYSSDDVLEVRYTLGAPVAVLQNDMVYVNSDINQAAFFAGNVSPAITPSAQNYQAVAHLYYISNFSDAAGDGVPSLHRVSLEPGPRVVDRMLLSGVERFQVQYGVDTDDDGLVNTYMDPNLVPATNWINVRSVQIWLVVRSLRNDPNLNTSTSANIAGVNTNFPNDGFRRYVVSNVVKFRNLKNASGI